MNPFLPVLLAAAGALLLAGCEEVPQPELDSAGQAPHTLEPAHGAATDKGVERLYGSVVESFDAGGFTYVRLDSGKQQFWAAVPTTRLVPGTMVAISGAMPMENYHSKNLDRDFELIYFADRIITDSHQAQASRPAQGAEDEADAVDALLEQLNPHEAITRAQPREPVPGIRPVAGGKSIDEIIRHRQDLAGQRVRVRGKVVKFTKEVLGHNWIHIQDSSSGADLTVTTDGTAAIGDIIVAEGTLNLDRDFGYGYVYALILEDAGITLE